MKTVFVYGTESESLIQVEQFEGGRKLFRVTYGHQQKAGLTYAQAAKELGECIFHQLACEGELANDGA